MIELLLFPGLLWIGIFCTVFSFYLIWRSVGHIRKRRWKEAANAALLITCSGVMSILLLNGSSNRMSQVIEQEGFLSFLILAFLPFGLLYWWIIRKLAK